MTKAAIQRKLRDLLSDLRDGQFPSNAKFLLTATPDMENYDLALVSADHSPVRCKENSLIWQYGTAATVRKALRSGWLDCGI